MRTHLELDEEEREQLSELQHTIKSMPRDKKDTLFIDVCRDVMANGARRYRGMLIDSFSASAYVAVYDRISEEKQIAIEKIVKNKGPGHAMGLVWRVVG